MTDEKKYEYWNHFVAVCFVGGGYPSITGPRLRKVKPIIWADQDFWFDILHRHVGNDMTPEQMAEFDGELYEYCCGNFWGTVHRTLVEKGLLV